MGHVLSTIYILSYAYASLGVRVVNLKALLDILSLSSHPLVFGFAQKELVLKTTLAHKVLLLKHIRTSPVAVIINGLQGPVKAHVKVAFW